MKYYNSYRKLTKNPVKSITCIASARNKFMVTQNIFEHFGTGFLSPTQEKIYTPIFSLMWTALSAEFILLGFYSRDHLNHLVYATCFNR